MPGVRNPAATAGLAYFYRDMAEVRIYVRRALDAMLDGDQESVEEYLKDAEAFIARRRAENWDAPTEPYRFLHTG